MLFLTGLNLRSLLRRTKITDKGLLTISIQVVVTLPYGHGKQLNTSTASSSKKRKRDCETTQTVREEKEYARDHWKVYYNDCCRST